MTLVRHTSMDYPEKDRVAILLDVYSVIERVEVDLLDRTPPESWCAVRKLPDLTILDALSRTECDSRRTPRHVADGKDDLVFTIITRGMISYSRNGSEPEFLEPGDAYLGYNDRPSEHKLRQHPGFIDIVVPRPLLGPNIADIDAVTRAKLPATPEIGLVTRYVTALTREFDDIPPETSALHAGHIRDLITLAVGARPGVARSAARNGVRAARLAAIKSDIAANLTRPGLTIQTIAVKHGISPQYVRSLFRNSGTTFSDYLLEKRLDFVREKLGDPLYLPFQISDIAFEAGFNDLSYFNRTFRRRFGMTPTDARELALSLDATLKQ